MNLSKRISTALAALALLVLVGAGTASAQTPPIWQVGSAAPFVANTGNAEVLGDVALTSDITCNFIPGGCITVGGNIQVLYISTPIDGSSVIIANDPAPGVGVCIQEIVGGAPSACNPGAGTYLSGAYSITNGPTGGLLNIGINNGVVVPAGDQIIVNGVRGNIANSPASAVGGRVNARLTTSPSNIASFSILQVEVAESADPLSITTSALTLLQCLPGGTGNITVHEGFPSAFVDHGDAAELAAFAGAPANPRPNYGGTNNSRVNIVLTDLPSGVTVSWPLVSAVDSSGSATGAQLTLVTQSASGNNATYVYSTPDQSVSDTSAEIFVITLSPANVTLSGTNNDFGTATAQGRMYPPTTAPPFLAPRYNHPLEPVPGIPLIVVAPCTTNLLFPWVANVAGYDTGFAIANTSSDPYGTTPQTGACTLNLFPTDTSTGDGVALNPASVTTNDVEGGGTYRVVMSSVPAFAGKAGYVIAVCQFQFGHGFGFITDNFGVGAPITAQGYLALIIPDPLILGGRSAAIGGTDLLAPFYPPYGEALPQ